MVAGLVVVLHVASVFWLVAGILGRDVAFHQARRAGDLASLSGIAQVATVFDLRMVRPGGLAVLLTGLAAAAMRGWPILGFLQGGASNWMLAALLVYLTLIPVIVLVFVPRLAVYEKALEQAHAAGVVTPELKAALADPVVARARVYELVVTSVILVLMVLKPF
jgi:uncharacterized membrane protein